MDAHLKRFTPFSHVKYLQNDILLSPSKENNADSYSHFRCFTKVFNTLASEIRTQASLR